MTKPEQIAAIVAITELFKQHGIPKKWCPFIAMGLGVIFSYAYNQTPQSIVDGIVMGAMTTGGYTVIQSSARGVLKKPAADLSVAEHDDYRGL